MNFDTNHELLRRTIIALALPAPDEREDGRGTSCRRGARLAVRNALQGDADPDAFDRALGRVPKSSLLRAEAAISRADSEGVKIVTILDEEYPPHLRQIDDPPLALFRRGASLKAALHDHGRPRRRVSIVGTRRAPAHAERFARHLARELAGGGGCVVSGLAAGIDGAAHRGAIDGATTRDGGTPGLAVLGSGILSIYPREHQLLADELIEAGGTVLSEYEIDATPRRHFFPERNRIVSGLSEAVVVIEAGARSGSLITARLALEQGRDVYAVPGDIWREGCQGSNALIRDGAIPVFSVDGLLELLGFESRTSTATTDNRLSSGGAKPRTSRSGSGLEKAEARTELPANQRAIVDLCANFGAVSIDHLQERLSRDLSAILPEVIALELKGWLRFDGTSVTCAIEP